MVAVTECDSTTAASGAAWYRLAKSNFMTGRRTEAVAALQRACELAPPDGSGTSYHSLLEEWSSWQAADYDGGAAAYEKELRRPLDRLCAMLPTMDGEAEEGGAASVISASFRGKVNPAPLRLRCDSATALVTRILFAPDPRPHCWHSAGVPPSFDYCCTRLGRSRRGEGGCGCRGQGGRGGETGNDRGTPRVEAPRICTGSGFCCARASARSVLY